MANFGNYRNVLTQIAKETVPGTFVAAKKKLLSMGIEISPDMEISSFAPRGAKFKVSHTLDREWAVGSLEGKLAFNEIQYALASIMDAPTITQLENPPGTPVEAYEYTFQMDQWAADNPYIFSTEQGDTARASRGKRATYGLVNALSIASERAGEVAISGETLHAALTLGQTMTTASVEEVMPVTASPKKVGWYVDPTPGAIGTTKVRNNFAFEFGLSDRYGHVWVHDDADEKFAEHNEGEPSATLSATVADDSGLDDIITSIRTGQRRYVVCKFVGPEIVTGINYGLELRMCLSVNSAPNYTDAEGTYAAELEFEAEYDDTLGYAVQAVLTTDQAGPLL